MSEARADRELLRELYEKYASRVYDRCRYLLRDPEEARDAMHDVFIKVSRNLSRYRGEASPLTWMTRIATNHCLNVIRAKNAAWHGRFEREVSTRETTHGGGMSWKEDAQILRLCLDQVDRDVAEAAVYYFVDELTQAEITELMGISAPTLRKRLRAFIETSRKVVAQHVPGAVFEEAPI